MSRIFRGLILVLLVALLPGEARARSSHQKWLEVRSPHFVVITNGRYSQARDVAEHFERIREVFLNMSPKMHVDPAEPVVILAVRNERDLKKLLPGYWSQKGHMHPDGLFVSGRDRNYVALRMDADSQGSYHIVYHEYVHLLESLNFSSLPVWVSEGLAEFYAAARIEGKDVGLGYPIPQHLALLRRGAWVPLKKLLTADHSSPLYNENNLSSIFYAESWELTHYLLTADKGAHQPELMQYIQLYERGVPSLTAARQTIGDLHKLDKKLADYSHQEIFNYLRVKTSIAGGKAAYPSHDLPPAEADAAIGDCYARTKRPVEARRTLQEAIRLNPKLARPYESLGMLALEERDRKSALKWLNRAVALGSKNYLVYYFHANLLLNREGRLAEPQAVSDMSRCIQLNANFAEGYRLLAQLYVLRDEKLSIAEGLVRRAIELKPAVSRNYLTLGLVLLRRGKADQAQAAAQKALSLTHSGTDRRRAEELIQHIREVRAEIAADSQPARPASTGARNGSASRVETDTVIAPAQGFTMVASGSASRLQCSGKQLKFLLMVNGSGVSLFAPDESAVQYVGAPASAGSPCAFLKGRRLSVRFRLVHGKPYFGQILEIDLSH
jgi:tetratricopeptide (TPR) repeat protein